MPSTPPYLVSIILYGDDLDPMEITGFLMTEPTKGWRKGQNKYPGKDKEYIARTGLWKLTAQSTSDKLDEHIHDLVNKLHERDVHKICSIPGVDISVFDIFAVEAYEAEPKDIYFSISAENIKAIAQMGLDISFTVGRVSGPD